MMPSDIVVREASRGNDAALCELFARVTMAGEIMPCVYLTHVSVEGDDPAIMCALIDRAYAELHGLGYNFITTFVLKDDPLAPAYARYQTTPIPAQLFTVSPPGSRKLANDDVIVVAVERLETADKTYLGVPMGHVDMGLGREAPERVWQPVRDWLAKR